MLITMYCPDEESLLHLAKKLSRCVNESTIIFLQGELGAGKTTFSRGFLQGLHYQGTVKSPTYTLVETYHIDPFVIHHFDFYRVRDGRELEFIGIQDYFASDAIHLIEWPERAKDFLPLPDLICKIDFYEEGRKVTMEGVSACGKDILKKTEMVSS